MKQKNGGFTLVELLITIVCASLITAAAVSLILLGLRMEAKAEDTVSRQQTTRIVLELMEDMAGSGQIETVEAVGEDWALLGAGNTVLLQYSNGALTTGGGSVLMDGLKSAEAELDNSGLLTFTVETEDGQYTSSVYCRTQVTSGEFLTSETENKINDKAQEGLDNTPAAAGTETARYEFLKELSAQYGSTGRIRIDIDNWGQYYSQWFNSSWPEDTPWCACFLSWALAQDRVRVNLNYIPRVAEVNEWIGDFDTKGTWHDGTSGLIPGDLIFFDWELDGNANHVGAVLFVDTAQGTVYTIEGNSGSGAVLLHRYSLSDQRILGYGVLDWKVT